jgi:hypothetical protein
MDDQKLAIATDNRTRDGTVEGNKGGWAFDGLLLFAKLFEINVFEFRYIKVSMYSIR